MEPIRWMRLILFVLVVGSVTIVIAAKPATADTSIDRSFGDNWSAANPSGPWSYWWNETGPIGGGGYSALSWNSLHFDSDGQVGGESGDGFNYGLVGEWGVHPGRAGGQGGSAEDRYAIVRYTVDVEATYEIRSTSMTNRGCASGGAELLILVNDGEVGRAAVSESSTFDRALGRLAVGDTIDVAVGPGDSNVCDAYDLDFRIVSTSAASTNDWTPASMAVVDPRAHGAAGDGIADDTAAIEAAMAALPSGGGIVYFPAGHTFRTTDVVDVPADHIKLWSPNGQAEIFNETEGGRWRQAVLCADVDDCGFFGLRFRTDAERRLMALWDSQLVLDNSNRAEVVGVEIENSASAAVFFNRASRVAWVEGNYIHDSWADSIHFTEGSHTAWVWDNVTFNGTQEGGDDAIACVTYGSQDLCRNMEWWGNQHFGGGSGRGFAVIGGQDIAIHDNFARDVAGAGIIVAAEHTFDSPSSRNVAIYRNNLYRTSQIIPHPGILISGLYNPIFDVSIDDNTVVEPASGEAFRREGDTVNVVHDNTSQSRSALPSPIPTVETRQPLRDTGVLKTRDTSFAPDGHRRGLYRVHVRVAPSGSGFEQRFEYVVAGATSALDEWTTGLDVVHRTDLGTESFTVVHSPSSLTLPAELRPVTFEELREGDRSGALGSLWLALDG